MSYAANKANARTVNNEPTLTDQSQARETDINVIVSRYGISGQVPGVAGEPLYQDWTELPTDYRDFIDLSRSVEDRRKALPKELQEMPVEELLALTPDKLKDILTPPAPEPVNEEGNEE